MAEADTTRIADAPDGAMVTVRGVVRLDPGASLVSPIGQKPCAYYEVHRHLLDEGALGAPDQREARDFLLEDSSGRALVVMQHHRVLLAAERRKQAVDALDADIDELSARLRELKDQLKAGGGGPGQRGVRTELQQGKALATLLCAIRAHARGKLHAASSLAEQEAFILRESARRSKQEDTGKRTVPVLIDRYEAALEDGQAVTVNGHASWEADPSATGGYRERPKRLVLRAPAGGQLLVSTPAGTRALVIACGADELQPTAGPGRSPRVHAATLVAALGLAAALVVVALERC